MFHSLNEALNMSGFQGNPYQSPLGAQYPSSLNRPSSEYPVFCRTMFIIDLVLCGLRGILVVFSLVGYSTMGANEPLMATAIYEILTGVVIAGVGLLANILLLCRQGWAVVLGYVTSLATVASVGVGLWQLSLMAPQAGGDPAQQAGFMAGAGCSLVFRLILIVLYVAALVRFSMWERRQKAS
jgi:hypothetical protein